jgi:hypothetical protein
MDRALCNRLTTSCIVRAPSIAVACAGSFFSNWANRGLAQTPLIAEPQESRPDSKSHFPAVVDSDGVTVIAALLLEYCLPNHYALHALN